MQADSRGVDIVDQLLGLILNRSGSYAACLWAVYKGRPANGEGVVLKFRTFPDGGRGWFVKVRTSENF